MSEHGCRTERDGRRVVTRYAYLPRRMEDGRWVWLKPYRQRQWLGPLSGAWHNGYHDCGHNGRTTL